MKKQDPKKTETNRKIVQIVAIDNDQLADVAGARGYGWDYGGWISGVKAPDPIDTTP